MNLTGDVIAGVAALSKYHFGKAFRQSTGVTLHGYVLARRIRRAEQLLIKSDLPLVAIRRRQRVCEQSHFTTVFSTRNGIPPAAFRQMRRAFTRHFTYRPEKTALF
jgi:transcriptional regulator GlxA family with amidase domain